MVYLLGKFYDAFCNIVIGSNRDEMFTVHFVKIYCLPTLLYSGETWHSIETDN